MGRNFNTQGSDAMCGVPIIQSFEKAVANLSLYSAKGVLLIFKEISQQLQFNKQQ